MKVAGQTLAYWGGWMDGLINVRPVDRPFATLCLQACYVHVSGGACNTTFVWPLP